ncbi:hypothetical protein RHAL1_00514 [Beijerinckiaceae bacterium RH AL1]|nr:hypothetical protein RHAL1_00514 [Beijerinckiaceae bacterium RH AL1]
MPDELPDALHTQIEALSERGNIARDAGAIEDAIAAWEQALALVPQPQAIWDAALWLHASIADALRAKGDVAAALHRFEAAARCADGATHPFVLLGLGACRLDLGHPDEAVDPLLRAYMIEGEDIFADEDPKYLGLLRQHRLVD